MREFSGIQKDEAMLIGNGCSIRNAVIKSIVIKVHGHIGNAVYPEIIIDDQITRNRHINFDYMRDSRFSPFIANIIDFFDLGKDEGVYLSEISNVPIRLVLDSDCFTIGFGHFLEDRFVLFEDIRKAEL